MVRWACGSRSIRQTRLPSSARAAPRLAVVVVLPTPPFWFISAMIRMCRLLACLPDVLAGADYAANARARQGDRAKPRFPRQTRVDRFRSPSFRSERMNFRGKRMKLRGKRMNFQGERMNLRGKRMNLRGKRMNLRGKRMAFRGKRMNLRGERMAFRGERMAF